MLTEEMAIQIYEYKLYCGRQQNRDSKSRSLRGQSGPIAKLFGVSSRAVRDIWNRQSWSFTTQPLWNRELAFSEIQTDHCAVADKSQVLFSEIDVLFCRDFTLQTRSGLQRFQ
jgi:hypothetical protein